MHREKNRVVKGEREVKGVVTEVSVVNGEKPSLKRTRENDDLLKLLVSKPSFCYHCKHLLDEKYQRIEGKPVCNNCFNQVNEGKNEEKEQKTQENNEKTRENSDKNQVEKCQNQGKDVTDEENKVKTQEKEVKNQGKQSYFEEKMETSDC